MCVQTAVVVCMDQQYEQQQGSFLQQAETKTTTAAHELHRIELLISKHTCKWAWRLQPCSTGFVCKPLWLQQVLIACHGPSRAFHHVPKRVVVGLDVDCWVSSAEGLLLHWDVWAKPLYRAQLLFQAY